MSACAADNALFHAAARDCSVPPYFYLGILVETAALTVVFLSVLAFKVRRLSSKRTSVRTLAALLAVHQVVVLAFATTQYVQTGFFEASAAVCCLFHISIFVALRTVVRISLNPEAFIFASQSENKLLRRILVGFDVYGVVTVFICWGILASMAAAARTSSFNSYMLAYLFMCTIGIGIAQASYMFVGIFQLESALRAVLATREHATPANTVESVLVKLKQLRRNFITYVASNAVVPTAVGIYIAVTGAFPAGVPLSAVLYTIIIHGFGFLTLMVFFFVSGNNTVRLTRALPASSMLTSFAQTPSGDSADGVVQLHDLNVR